VLLGQPLAMESYNDLIRLPISKTPFNH